MTKELKKDSHSPKNSDPMPHMGCNQGKSSTKVRVPDDALLLAVKRRLVAVGAPVHNSTKSLIQRQF